MGLRLKLESTTFQKKFSYPTSFQISEMALAMGACVVKNAPDWGAVWGCLQKTTLTQMETWIAKHNGISVNATMIEDAQRTLDATNEPKLRADKAAVKKKIAREMAMAAARNIIQPGQNGNFIPEDGNWNEWRRVGEGILREAGIVG